MRELTAKQKKLLSQWQDERGVSSVDELTLEEMEQLEAINDTEVLWQNSNRFLSDRAFNKLR
jgi:hypothetical protein